MREWVKGKEQEHTFATRTEHVNFFFRKRFFSSTLFFDTFLLPLSLFPCNSILLIPIYKLQYISQVIFALALAFAFRLFLSSVLLIHSLILWVSSHSSHPHIYYARLEQEWVLTFHRHFLKQKNANDRKSMNTNTHICNVIIIIQRIIGINIKRFRSEHFLFTLSPTLFPSISSIFFLLSKSLLIHFIYILFMKFSFNRTFSSDAIFQFFSF